jgi:CheY-like chemotaxis protein
MATVLIVEDDSEVRRAFARFIESEGHDAIGVASAEEALAIVGEIAFNAAFVDLDLPRMDGLKLMRELLRDHPQIGIVVMSGLDQRIDFEECETGIVQYIPKPMTLDQARDALKVALRLEK